MHTAQSVSLPLCSSNGFHFLPFPKGWCWQYLWVFLAWQLCTVTNSQHHPPSPPKASLGTIRARDHSSGGSEQNCRSFWSWGLTFYTPFLCQFFVFWCLSNPLIQSVPPGKPHKTAQNDLKLTNCSSSTIHHWHLDLTTLHHTWPNLWQLPS